LNRERKRLINSLQKINRFPFIHARRHGSSICFPKKRLNPVAIPDPEQLFIVHVDSVVYNFSIAVETSGEYSERDLYFLRPIGKIQSNWGDYYG
jgi:hypothetical protein